MVWPFRKRQYTEESILNEALHLAMDWGKDWLQPIQSRLGKAYPKLSQSELDSYNAIAQESMRFGNSQVYSMAEKEGSGVSQELFSAVFRAKYSWANDKNISRCFSQGMYYAWKDLGF